MKEFKLYWWIEVYKNIESNMMRNQFVMRNRITNEIECIKFRLAKRGDLSLYNDLVIIGHIVPKLPNEMVLEMLTILKQFNDYINESSSL